MICLCSSCDLTHLEGLLCSSSDGSVECTLTPVVLDVRIFPCGEEFLDIVSAGTDSSKVESSPAVVIGGVQLHSGAEKNVHGAVEGGSGEGVGGTAGVRVGDHLHVLGNGREEEAVVFAVFTGRIGEELLLRDGSGKLSGVFWVTANMSGVYPPGPGVFTSLLESSPRNFSRRPRMISGLRTAL